MLEIKCPHCGKRSQNEFSYGGDASVKRPQLGKEISDKEWDDYVYFRTNPRGKHSECARLIIPRGEYITL